VAEAVAGDQRPAEIAAALGLARSTVSFHLARGAAEPLLSLHARDQPRQTGGSRQALHALTRDRHALAEPQLGCDTSRSVALSPSASARR